MPTFENDPDMFATKVFPTCGLPFTETVPRAIVCKFSLQILFAVRKEAIKEASPIIPATPTKDK
mgnify:CR=1 FL=1